MKALFIGRFQPFHKGHLEIISKITKEYDHVIIVIGSSQYYNTHDNPFTIEERKKMMEETLKRNYIENYEIVEIPDIHNPPKWVDHVCSIVSDFDIVITNSDFTKKLFSEKGFTVKNTPMYKRNEYSGKKIRKLMIDSDKWEHLVPNEVLKIIKQINLSKRFKK